MKHCIPLLALILCLAAGAAEEEASRIIRVPYHNPSLVVDLGVGLWAQPLPMDFDKDGDNDLLVATADKPSNGLYFFENASGNVTFPVFRPGVRLDDAKHNITISYTDQGQIIQITDQQYPDFENSFFKKARRIDFKAPFYQGRAKQWKRYDYDGDGVLDLICGVSDWQEYGWDNAFNDQGEWTNGPLHGYVYVVRNAGSFEDPTFEEPFKVQAGEKDLDVYGCPSPNFEDWDGDGDLDLICGEFLDKLTYFENTGARTAPVYAEGRVLTHDGAAIKMDLEMLQVVAFDWDKDGDMDLIVGQEDGRVALVENTGKLIEKTPAFLPPRFFQQQAEYLKVGALATPDSVDWDGDGDEDLIVGDTAGYVSVVENLDGAPLPQWAAPRYLEAGGERIRIQAGPNGSIQGPAEAKWGYTVLNAADWNHDGLPDIMLNSIWGKILWYENIGEVGKPKLAKAQPVEVAWPDAPPKPAWYWWNPEGKALVTQWRTTPEIIDLNEDGLQDLVMLDTEGYLAFFERKKDGEKTLLLPGKRIFLNEKQEPFQLNSGIGGKSGRRKFVLSDWDGDAKLDLLINSKNVDFMRNIGDADHPYVFKNTGLVDPRILAGHTTCPTVVDWDKNGIPDLLFGAEDGFFYYLPNPRAK